ncbi:MAG: hypothetical protein GWP91_15300 [Rhodobacterales bacterium]|nr:hypothetical protein [Rhodobacterales bacterium]
MDSYGFKIQGFNVEVQPTFFLLLGVFALFDLQSAEPLWSIASFSVVVFGSIVLHELGHAFAARKLKLRVGSIVLHGMGGHVTHSVARKPQHNLLVSLAGPGAGLCLGIPLVALQSYVPGDNYVLHTIIRHLVWVNVGWSLFNLLPMMPLDGGNALRSALRIWLHPGTAVQIAAGTGALLGLVFGLLGYSLGATFLMFFGGYVAYTNLRMYQQAS